MTRGRARLAGGLVLGAVAVAAGATVGLRRVLTPQPDGSPPRSDGTRADDRTGAPGGFAFRPPPPAHPTGSARVLPPPWEPAWLRAVAAWEPAPPTSSIGRCAAYLWAAPTSLAGLLAVAASGIPDGRTGAVRVTRGVLLRTGAGGLSGLALRLRGFGAVTLGHVVLARAHPISPSLLTHELLHTRQAERLGPLMGPVYLALLAVYRYARHPMERAARLAQRR